VSGAASGVALPEALERAASALPELADAIRPANGDPSQLLASLDTGAAARVVEWLLRHEPDSGAELAGVWAEDPGRGAEALARLEGEGLGKQARKALRRAHHRLRSRGVALPERPPAPLVAKLPPLEDRLDAALVSALDPGGARAAWLVAPNPGGGARLFELLLDEERGVVAFDVYTAGRSRVRKFAREVMRGPDARAVEVPPDSLRALVARTAAAHPSDRALPRGFEEWRSSVARPPADAHPPGEIARRELGAEAEPGAAERVAERVRSGALGPWPPASPRLRETAEAIAEIRKGRIVVSGAHRRQQIDEALREAAEKLAAAGFAEATARRLEESAYVLWKRGHADEARDCLAAARALAESPAAHPVLRALIETTLGPVLAGSEDE